MDGVYISGGTPGVHYSQFHYLIGIIQPGEYTLRGNPFTPTNFRIVILAPEVKLTISNINFESPQPFYIQNTGFALFCRNLNTITGTHEAPLTSDFDFEIIGSPGGRLSLYRSDLGWHGLLAATQAGTRIGLHSLELRIDLSDQNPNRPLAHPNAIVTTHALTEINGVHVHHNTQPMPNLHPDVGPTHITMRPTNFVPGAFGRLQYSLNGGPWAQQDWETFWDLEPGTTYSIRAKYASKSGINESSVASMTITTPVEYTVNIPATMQADGTSVDITVGDHLVLGASGRLDITINGGTIQDNGRLQLHRLNSGDMIRSQLLVDDEIFNVRIGGVRQSIATFTMTNQDPVPISFAAPDEATILAGRYEGTVVFGISYSD